MCFYLCRTWLLLVHKSSYAWSEHCKCLLHFTLKWMNTTDSFVTHCLERGLVLTCAIIVVCFELSYCLTTVSLACRNYCQINCIWLKPSLTYGLTYTFKCYQCWLLSVLKYTWPLVLMYRLQLFHETKIKLGGGSVCNNRLGQNVIDVINLDFLISLHIVLSLWHWWKNGSRYYGNEFPKCVYITRLEISFWETTVLLHFHFMYPMIDFPSPKVSLTHSGNLVYSRSILSSSTGSPARLTTPKKHISISKEWNPLPSV